MLLFAHAPGHNNSAGYLTFPKYPRFGGIRYAKETFAPGAVYVDGPYAELLFKALEDAELAALLAADGFSSESVRSVALTVRLPNQAWTAGIDYNCTAVRPRWGVNGAREQLRYKNVVYRLFAREPLT